MPDRYVQLPNGSYLQWPEGVSAATFKAKATKLMGPSLPVSTRKAADLPLPTAQPPKPFMSRLSDYVSQIAQSTAKTPGSVIDSARNYYKEGEQQGGFTGGMRMAEAPIMAEGDANTGMLKSVLGVTAPGIAYRVSKNEDPAKIAADAGTFLGGYMAGGPKEATAGEGLSVGDAAKQITDAVNPAPKEMAAFQRSVSQHLDKITTFAKQNGIDIGSIGGLSEAMKGAGNWIRTHYYNEILGPVKDRPVSIAGTIPGYSGETASPSTATLGQLDARLSQINAELNPKYSKGGIAGQAAVKSATELNAEAAGIRKQLYDAVGKATGLTPEQVAQTRGAFGSLDSLAEKTATAAAKERFAANKTARAPLTVNPFGDSGKQFIADKAVNAVRGDVVGKGIKTALGKVKVKPYELPAAKPTSVAARVRTPLRGESGIKTNVETSGPAERAAVPEKLDARRMLNEVTRKKAELDKANAQLQKTVKSSRHPFWQDPRGSFEKGDQ